ncbi:MAG: penicillin-binding transpeptidase domain-containing protein, partial [candidate division WOR-3 bacterium]
CTGRHGQLTLIPAIVHSCNVYFYQLGLKVGIDPLASCLRDLGFGRVTGIDLLGERSGTVPDRAWLDRRYGPERWTIGVVLNLAIGQGELLATPLQLALFYSKLAKNGEWYTPRLLDYARAPDGHIERTLPRRQSTAISPDDARILREALAGVVTEGTGWAAAIPGVRVSGKTGTAEHTGGEDHAWFVGYAGRSEPEIAFAVIVENGGKGGAVAAPIARELVKEFYGIKEQVLPEEVEEPAGGAEVVSRVQVLRMPDSGRAR